MAAWGAVLPATAWAHSALTATTPAASATVTEPLDEVTLTFNEHPHQRFSVVVVRGPGGVSYSDGGVRVVDATVHQAVHPLKSGRYTVGWRVVSADDHPVQGEFSFTVALPAELEPAAGPPAASTSAQGSGDGRSGAAPGSSGGGMTGWGTATSGSVLVVLMVAGAVLLRRRRRPPDRPMSPEIPGS
jgi:methionine-rich copper-binding protein CopC